MVWKLLIMSANFSDCLETFWVSFKVLIEKKCATIFRVGNADLLSRLLQTAFGRMDGNEETDFARPWEGPMLCEWEDGRESPARSDFWGESSLWRRQWSYLLGWIVNPGSGFWGYLLTASPPLLQFNRSISQPRLFPKKTRTIDGWIECCHFIVGPMVSYHWKSLQNHWVQWLPNPKPIIKLFVLMVAGPKTIVKPLVTMVCQTKNQHKSFSSSFSF